MENYLAPAQRLWHFLGLSSRKRHLKKKKREPHSTPDVTERCRRFNARANARDVSLPFLCVCLVFFLFFLCCFMFVSNKASTYGLSPILLLNSLPVKKKLKTDSKPRSFI